MKNLILLFLVFNSTLSLLAQEGEDPLNCQTQDQIWVERYYDIDNDGVGGQQFSKYICPGDPYPGVANGGDCNDNDPNIITPVKWYQDTDNDGYGSRTVYVMACSKPSGYISDNRDCDDNNASITLETRWYEDNDGDGKGVRGTNGILACTKPAGSYVLNNEDCNDNNAAIGFSSTWYVDSDGDSFGEGNPVTSSNCDPPNDGKTYVSNSNDKCPGVSGQENGCPPEQTDVDEPWNTIKVISYDITSKEVAKSKSYFDALGKPVQTQSKDLKTGETWAAQTLYDSQGRPALQTLSAPTNADINLDFFYKEDFVKKVNGSKLTVTDFENDPENPSVLGTQINSLGWYYSTANTKEPYQDITERPYSRTIYSELNPGAILKTVGGNKIDGQWKNGYVFSMPAGQELSSTAAFGDAKYNDYKIVKTISRDVHGVDNVVFTDTDDNTLAAARSGNENGNTSSRTSTVVMGAQGYVDVHIPVGLQGVTVTQNQSLAPKQIEIYNLITEKKIATSLSNLSSGFYRIAVANLNDFDAAAQNIKIAYPENYYDYSLNEYDKAGRLVSSYQPLHKLKSEYQYNALGQLEYTKSPDEGEAWFKYRRDGQIRFSQNSKQQAAGEFSYTNYDDRGRPIESGVLIHTGFTTSDPDANLPSGTKKEQHVTQYDSNDNSGLSTVFGSDTRKSNYAQQSFVASNVAKTYTVNPETTTTWYSYDIYGRIRWIVQQINGLSGVKTIDYVYDPVTSQVTKVYYQKGMPGEQFVHRYTYDPADYSLTKVETSVDDTNFTEQATYEYYETGGLKRTNIAQGLQGIDYIYNLQGALKSINHPSLTNSDDPGGDTNDLFGMILDYHNEDYNRPVGRIKSAPYGKDQYNGNIKGIRWNSDYNPIQEKHHVYSYQYDRNNWLKSAVYGTYGEGATATGQEDIISTDVINSGGTLDLTANRSITLKPGFHSKAGSTFSASIIGVQEAFNEDSNGDYKVDNITYDANGNILSLHRNKHTENGSNVMDQLSYKYYDDPNPANPNEPYKPNQLRRVEDAVGDVAGADDIGDQNGDNYEYNSIGQLIKNSSENITYIYNASGLVTEVKKGNQPLVKFFYNDKGHRVRKESYNPSNGSLTFTEHYVRDAAGTAMAIYRNGQVIENTIYGASRLGIRKSDGIHLYQLTDHLGNVRAVVGRNAQGQPMAMTSATDYYPFGMPMPNRKITNEPYRYAYQGQELDPETGKEAFQLRLWDSRIGRWLSPDPYGQFHSPYLGMGNNPITGVDPDGGCVDKNGNPCPKGEFEGQLNTDFYGNVWKWEDGTYNTTNPIALDEVILGGATKYDIVRADMKAEWMGDFYRGRSELSSGTIELMVNVTSAAMTFGEGAAVIGSVKWSARGLTRFFWTGGGEGGASQIGAQSLAAQTGGVSVDMMWYGAAAKRVSPFVQKISPNKYYGKMWDAVSVKFARGAQMGRVHTVFGPTRTGKDVMKLFDKTGKFIQNSTWYRKEFPILKDKSIDYITHIRF